MHFCMISEINILALNLLSNGQKVEGCPEINSG